jgi:hypothetical protein
MLIIPLAITGGAYLPWLHIFFCGLLSLTWQPLDCLALAHSHTGLHHLTGGRCLLLYYCFTADPAILATSKAF